MKLIDIFTAVLRLRKKTKQIWESRIARRIAIVASGAAVAQAISIGFMPIITRLYGPESFGILGSFMAIVAVAVPLSALAYPLAIVLPKDDIDALCIARLSIVLSLIIASMVGLLLIDNEWLPKIVGIELIHDYLYILPLAMLFAAWSEIVQQWLIRKRKFVEIAQTTILQSLILNITKSGLGLVKPKGMILILVSTFGYALYSALLFYRARESVNKKLIEKHIAKRMTLREIAYQHRDFPLYRAPQNIINAVSQSLPLLMLAAFFGPTAAGHYTLAKIALEVPSSLLGKAVHDVLYSRLGDAAHNKDNLFEIISRSTVVLIAIGMVPFGFFIMFAPWLFDFIFGSEWLEAGEYGRWLAFFYFFNFINKPSVAAVPILGIQRGLLIYEFFSTGGKILSLFIGFYWFESDLYAIAMFSIMGVIAYILMMLWIMSRAIRWKTNEKTS